METLLLTQREAALALRCSERTLERLRVSGLGPKFVRCGRRSIRYREADLSEWIASGHGSLVGRFYYFTGI
jgi:predicted DNA-binding transcriptional regulator AlpA